MAMRRQGIALTGAMLSFLLSSLPGLSGAVKEGEVRHVLLITLDTTRANRLGCYGYKGASTPQLDGLAQKGVRFLRAYAHTPLTFPSHCSILTGTSPLYHLVRNNGSYYLDAGIPTLAETLRSAGYKTAGFIASFTLDSRFGLDRGFELYNDDLNKGEILKNFRSERKAGEVVDAFLPWLARNAQHQFFAWIHFYDPHLPYAPPSPFKEMLPKSPYDGEIAYVDFAVGKVLEMLKEKGILDDTLIVVAGDHGEALGEHREIDHGLFLYEGTMRVPLLFVHGKALPQGETVPATVRLMDIMPTILELAKLPVPKTVQGISLLPWIAGRTKTDLAAYMETYYPRENFGWSELRGVTDGRWKFIQAPRPELFDLAGDPHEETNLFQKAPSRSREMVRKFQDVVRANSQATDSPKRRMTSEEQERLRSLGYLGGGGRDAEDAGPKADPKDKIDEYLLSYRANLMEGEGNFSEAYKLYSELLQSNPEVPAYYVSAGFVLMKMERTKEAIELLERARDKFPSSALVLSRLVSFYLKAERWDDAIGASQVLLNLEPNDFEALFLSGSAFAMLGKWSEALDHYARALRIEPENKTLRQRHAFALAAAGRVDESLESYRRLKREFPEDYVFDLDVGQIYERTGQIAKARSVLKEASQRYPCADTFHAYAMILGKAGDFAEAVRWMRAYLSVAPEKDSPRKTKALALIGDWEKRK